jgi:hypothetical protein
VEKPTNDDITGQSRDVKTIQDAKYFGDGKHENCNKSGASSVKLLCAMAAAQMN